MESPQEIFKFVRIMWQNIAIIIIGILVAVYACWKIYQTFTFSKNNRNPCNGCCGCSMKDQIENKKDCPSKENKRDEARKKRTQSHRDTKRF